MSVLDLDGATFRVSLDALPTAPGVARYFLTQLLDLWGIKSDAADDALVMLSELVTNALQATGRAAGPTVPRRDETVPVVFVTARATWHGLHVEIWDSCPNKLPQLGKAADDAESGRGLFLVESLATRWGCYAASQRPRQAPGKVTWFYLEHPTRPQPRAAQRPQTPTLPRRTGHRESPGPPRAPIHPTRRAEAHPPRRDRPANPRTRADRALQPARTRTTARMTP
jgi:anti-sigma regulatory factor (Ser/Thr protein kinase)